MKIKTTSLLLLGYISCMLSYSQDFPKLDETFRLKQLQAPSGKIRMVLDTDTFNEVDDQFSWHKHIYRKKKFNWKQSPHVLSHVKWY